MVKVRATPLGDGWVCGVEDLVERSFAFLLEREPLGSILRRFDLGLIRRYFPEYDRSSSASPRIPPHMRCPIIR